MNTIKNSYNSLEEYLYQIYSKYNNEILISKKLMKIEDEKIVLPTIHSYQELLKYNYNLQQLKSFAKFHRLKISGNKKELLTRVYLYLKLSFFIIKIQKRFRGFLHRNYLSCHGVAAKNLKLCTNSTDFITMEGLEEISFQQFFSFQDTDGFIYGFDCASFYHLLFQSHRCIKHIQNPYNRRPIPEEIVQDFRRLLRMSRIVNQRIRLVIEDDSHGLSYEKTIELRALTLFQNIDSLGNYSDSQWFLSLNRTQIHKMMREIMDIWNYRAQLSIEVKRAICPPHGDPFRYLNLYYLQNEPELMNVKKVVLEVLEKFVMSGIDRDSQILGAYYVLGALTLVNPSAANALPWLFQSLSMF
jgi:hypothetical protein